MPDALFDDTPYQAEPEPQLQYDPLSVPCPTCKVLVGRRCRRPSGHTVFGGGVHSPRLDAAAAAVRPEDPAKCAQSPPAPGLGSGNSAGREPAGRRPPGTRCRQGLTTDGSQPRQRPLESNQNGPSPARPREGRAVPQLHSSPPSRPSRGRETPLPPTKETA